MEPQSVSFSYNYSNFATPKFYWRDHKYKNDVEKQKITVSQVLKVELKNKELTFLILDQSQAGLSKKSKFISDPYNEGTFIDILSYSFKPVGRFNCIQTGDSFTATLAKVCEFQAGSNRGINLGMNFNLGMNTAYEGRSHDVSSNGIISYSTSQSSSTNTQEFEGRKFKDGSKNIIEFDMKLCYDGNLNPVPYDINNLSTLKCSKHMQRILTLFIPSDILYKVPEAARSSFAADWSLRYEIENFQDLEFEWSTEVRTVFASNQMLYRDVNGQLEPLMVFAELSGMILNWIKTVHKITHVIKINVNNEGIPSIQVMNRNIKVISMEGYNKESNKVLVNVNSLHDQDHITTENTVRLHRTHKESQASGRAVLLDSIKMNIKG